MAAENRDGPVRKPEWADKNLIKQDSISVWSGSPHDLLVLATAIDKRLEKLRAEALESFDENFREHKFRMRLPWVGRKARNEREKLRKGIEQRCTVTIELADRESATTTAVFSAVEENDRLLINAPRITLKGEVKQQGGEDVKPQSCIITFEKNNIKLQVQGNTWWVRDTFPEIKSMLKENRPVWWILRSAGFLVSMVVVFVVTGSILAFRTIDDSPWVFFSFFFGSYVISALIIWAITSIFPKFEVRSTGQSTVRQTVRRVTLGTLAILVSLAAIAGSITSIIYKK